MVLGVAPLAYQMWFFCVCWRTSPSPLRTTTAESCHWMACVSSRDVFDVEQCTTPSGLASVADRQGVSVALHSALQRPHTHPPTDSVFMLCGLAMDLWQDQCSGRYSDSPKERQMEESALASDSTRTRLITAVSYQHTLICQPHTTYSSATSLCFFPFRSIH